MRCLCCNKEIVGNDVNGWDASCVRRFFGTSDMPGIDFAGTDLSFDEEAMKLLDDSSVTGVQKKLSFYLSDSKREKRLTFINDAAPGYIVKINSNELASIVQAEHLTMLLADILGIKTVPHALYRLKNGKLCYISKRIDREVGKKIHMEDFCQLSDKPSEYKYNGSYEKVADIIDMYSMFKRMDKSELFRRIVFCFLTSNSDMHLKNFSLIYSDIGIRLSDAYDLVPAQLMVDDPDETALAINGKRRNLRKNDFISFGLHIGLDDKYIRKTIDGFVSRKDDMIAVINDFDMDSVLKERFIDNLNQRVERLK